MQFQFQDPFNLIIWHFMTFGCCRPFGYKSPTHGMSYICAPDLVPFGPAAPTWCQSKVEAKKRKVSWIITPIAKIGAAWYPTMSQLPNCGWDWWLKVDLTTPKNKNFHHDNSPVTFSDFWVLHFPIDKTETNENHIIPSSLGPEWLTNSHGALRFQQLLQKAWNLGS